MERERLKRDEEERQRLAEEEERKRSVVSFTQVNAKLQLCITVQACGVGGSQIQGGGGEKESGGRREEEEGSD